MITRGREHSRREVRYVGSPAAVTGPGLKTAPFRETQSFVYTLSECWNRPWLTVLEVLWRWAFGVPAIVLLAYEANRIWAGATVDKEALWRMSLFDPMSAALTLSQAAAVVLPSVLNAAAWVVPLLAAAWTILSGVGRSAVLRRIDARLHSRPGTLMGLHALRLSALAASFAVWAACLKGAAEIAVDRPIAAGQEPELVAYCAIVIVATLGMFTVWAVTSWSLSVAPLLAMRLDVGVWASLAAALRSEPLKPRLVEINLVMGIVKIALIVLAMVLSACPLPFESVATPRFMAWWYAGTTVIYLIASDFFHVVQLVAYLKLWSNQGEMLLPHSGALSNRASI